MIYTDQQLIEKIKKMIIDFEDEVVEFKEARTNYSFKNIGKYFSALGNEANIRGYKEAWLIFGVSDNKKIVGTAYRQDGSLQNLKKEIVSGTNERATFMEIYEIKIEGHRIIAFQIPPATRGIPTTWNGAAYAREDENVSPLPINKMDLIRSQIGTDWSKEIVDGATFEDLDPEAVAYARELFIRKQDATKKSTEMLSKMSDEEILNKAGILIKGKITNTALILLGKEALNNCIAHSNYQLRGKINLEEFEDRLIFMNEGNFIPETVEKTLEEGYKPPYYRNTFLCRAMVNLYMIDTNSMGIPMMYQIQKDKCFPLPTYDLNEPNRVKVTLYGKILDKNYTKLLYSSDDLDLQTVFLLDKVQKHEIISKESCNILRKRGLIEGRYPNIYVSYKIANMVGKKMEYVKNKGFSNDSYKKIICDTLETMEKASPSELRSVLEDVMPAVLSQKQKARKLSNMLQTMKKSGIVDVEGSGHKTKWYLKQKH